MNRPPPIGAVAVIVGIIAAIVLAFIGRKPPPSPEETFVKEQSVPFVQELQLPSAKWMADQQAVSKHLEGGNGPSGNGTSLALA